MGRDALRKHDERPHRPRSRQLRRACARREGQDPRDPLAVAVPDRRLFRRPRHGERAVLAALHPRGLRRADHAHRVQGPVHQHAAGGPVSRRRTAGGRLFHRAHDRACGEADRHGRRRDPPRQSDRAGQIPLQHADALHLRLGRVRAPARQVRRDGRLEGLRQARRASRRRTASCAAARSATTSSSAASSTTAWTSASIRAAPSRSSAARIRTGRGTRRCLRSACTNGSACRSSRSATCRATPRRCGSGAAPTGRAARWSAAARSSAPRTRSSRRPSRWPPP